MLDFTMPDFQTLLIYVIPLIFAITIHEVAHGWVANQRGDSTAKMLGRLTLNPVKHIDLCQIIGQQGGNYSGTIKRREGQ
jgi:Zn-dependent protease